MKKGITLVALVVTIVILLILATVTIALIIGENSMFNRANEGKVKSELSQIGERMQSAGAAILADYQTDLININNPNVIDYNSSTAVGNKLKEYNTVDASKITLTGSNGVYQAEFQLEDDTSGIKLTFHLNFDEFKAEYVIE